MTTSQRRIDWVKRWLPFVNQITKGTGILPGLVVSVAILESSKNGVPAASVLALKPNYNLFGITTGSNWNGASVKMSDAGNPRTFRVYPNQNESFKDFVKLLSTTSRYKDVDTGATVYEQAKIMNDAGYSETKDYPDRVQAVWETLQGNYSDVKNIATNKQSGTGFLFTGATLVGLYFLTK
jgi:flagellum-specific peptidoglycan hydrolase FlgJ